MDGKIDEQKLFYAMVKGMIKQLEQRKVLVLQADIQGYEQPKVIGKNRPDIVGENQDGKKVIVTVETGSAFNSEQTKKKYEEFAYAEGEFWVEVPESLSKDIAGKIKEWSIPVDKWFVGHGI